MSASYLRTVKFCFSKTSLNLRCYFLQLRSFNSQAKFRNAHYRRLTYSDSQIRHLLSRNKLQDARNLINEMTQRNPGHVLVVHLTSLLTKFSKHGFVDESKALFELMPLRNVVTYNAMLSGFLQNGRLGDASRLFKDMPEKNVVSWTAMICGLADSGRLSEAKRLFEEMPERNVVSWNSMVVGLIRNGELEEARQIFDGMPEKNIVSWNTMIAGYAESCRMEEARVLFEEMEERNVVTWTSMIAGYCRAGEVDKGYFLFRGMPERNVVSWTAMIGGFAWNGLHEEALLLFVEMMENYEVRPNGETLISLAYACAGMGFPQLGKQLHAQVIVNSLAYYDYDGRLSRSLILMYSSFGIMDFAHYIFNKNMNICTVQSCNAMINGYIRIGRLEEAQTLFDTIPDRDEISWTSLIDGYLSTGQVSKACYLFNNMPDKDGVAWTAMISGHVQNELFAEATNLFSEMRAYGISPLNFTYSILFGAAGATANIDQGRQIHCMMIKMQSELDLLLENSLISMYAKCGVIDDAYNIFSNMVSRDLVSWNSIIMGFSHHGLASETLKVFKSMLESGTHPNSVTFLGVLSACSHAGMVSQGWKLFNVMRDVYAIQPGLEHHVCMINLLGRAGKVKEAEEYVLRLPFKPDHHIWGALLGVCGFGETNAEIAKSAAKRLLELDPLNGPGHVVLCNIYAANGWHVEEQKLRKEMGLKGLRKVPGCSWIILSGKVHMFLSGDKLEVGGRSNVRPTESSLCFNSHATDVTHIASSGSVIAASRHSSNGVNVIIWDTLAPPTTFRASIICHEGGARSISVFGNDIGSGSVSPLIEAGGKGGDVGIYDFRYIATGRTKRHRHLDHHEPSINSSSNTDTRTGVENKSGDHNGMLWYIPKARSGSVTRISSIPNTSLFLIGSKDRDVKLWDTKATKSVYHWPKLHERHMFLQPGSRAFGGVVRVFISRFSAKLPYFILCWLDVNIVYEIVQTKYSRLCVYTEAISCLNVAGCSSAVTDIQVVSHGFFTCGSDSSVKLVISRITNTGSEEFEHVSFELMEKLAEDFNC